MRRIRRSHRAIAVVTTLVLVAAACGNSKSQSKSANSTLPIATTTPAGVTTTTQDLSKFVPLPGVKGVTNKEIRTTAVISVTNLIGGQYKQLIDGVNAYFNMVNSKGGIYGRKLVNVNLRDDQGANNLQQTQDSLAQDNAFANFGATYISFAGASALDAAHQPTFIWNINPEMAGHNNIFANEGALCFTCSGPTLPWLAKQIGAKKVAILGYAIPSSQECGDGTAASFKQYDSGATVVYKDFTLPLDQPLASTVSTMKAKGVDFVLTCTDRNETQILGKEMVKQGLKAVQELPNGYDANFVKANAQYYEGDYVAPQYTGIEQQPQLPEITLFLSWLHKEHKSFVELSADGWILADELVTGLELAGPNFTQQKVIDALNGVANFSDNGFIQPINWSTAHIDPETHPEVRQKVDCSNWLVIKNGKFVPVFAQPGKPWICLPTSDNSLTQVNHVTFAPQG
jgi:ABC-type branched-subunit amino acid transport system substrate-binding protein